MKDKLLTLFLFIVFLIPLVTVFSDESGRNAIVVCNETPCSWNDFALTVNNFIKAIVTFSFWIAFLMVSIGAFMIMLGGTSESRYKQGKDLIWTAIWAYVLILGSGIIFDIILEFFSPTFKSTSLNNFFIFKLTYAEDGTSGKVDLTPRVFYDPLKNSLMSSLQCGTSSDPFFGSPALGRLFSCAFEVAGLLKDLAIILLIIAIISSAAYLISTPLFGLKQIPRAYKILVWSIVGLIIILLADVIKSQIEILVK
jgi:hypothetical protein